MCLVWLAQARDLKELEVCPARLQVYEVRCDNEVTPDGELVYFALIAGGEPINYIEALKNMKWKSSIVKELQQIERNNTWELVEFLAHTKDIKVKCVLKMKRNVDSSIEIHKER